MTAPPAVALGDLVRVSCCQLAPVLGDLAANFAMSTAAVRAAIDDGARLIVLPELVTSGYVFESIADGADWIWRYGPSFLAVEVGKGRVQVVEILDFWHGARREPDFPPS